MKDPLDALADEQWTDPPSTALLLDHVVRDERSRAARRMWIAAPLLLLLGACVTYGAIRRSSMFRADVELKIDGEPSGVHAVEVDVVDGRVLPVRVPVDGHGVVELQLDTPEGVDPHSLDGMRVEVWLTSER